MWRNKRGVTVWNTHHVLVERRNVRAHAHSVAELRKGLHTLRRSVGGVLVTGVEPERPVLFGPAQVKWHRVVDLYRCCVWRQPVAFQDSPESIAVGVDVASDEGLRFLLALHPDGPVLRRRLRPSVPVGVVVGHGVLHRALLLQLLPADAVAHHRFGVDRLYEEVELSGIGPRAAQNTVLLWARVQVESAGPEQERTNMIIISSVVVTQGSKLGKLWTAAAISRPPCIVT